MGVGTIMEAIPQNIAPRRTRNGCTIVLLSPRNGKGLDASLYSAGMTAGKLIS